MATDLLSAALLFLLVMMLKVRLGILKKERLCKPLLFARGVFG